MEVRAVFQPLLSPGADGNRGGSTETALSSSSTDTASLPPLRMEGRIRVHYNIPVERAIVLVDDDDNEEEDHDEGHRKEGKRRTTESSNSPSTMVKKEPHEEQEGEEGSRAKTSRSFRSQAVLEFRCSKRLRQGCAAVSSSLPPPLSSFNSTTPPSSLPPPPSSVAPLDAAASLLEKKDFCYQPTLPDGSGLASEAEGFELPVAIVQQVFRSRKDSAVKLVVSFSSSSPSYAASFISFYETSLASMRSSPTSTLGNLSSTSFSNRCWTGLSLLLTFSSLPKRESFLQEMMEKAQQEAQTPPFSHPFSLSTTTRSGIPLSSSSSPSFQDPEVARYPKKEMEKIETTAAAEEKKTAGGASLGFTKGKREPTDHHTEEEEEPSDTSAGGASLLPVALSHFFSDTVLSSSSTPSSLLRGVSQVSTNVLESILIDPHTWELRPLTESMEADILRQLPSLAVLYQRFVRGGKAKAEEEEQETNEEEDGTTTTTTTGCSRSAFWAAVARQYFCLAHTFLEEDDDENDEGMRDSSHARTLGTRAQEEKPISKGVPGGSSSEMARLNPQTSSAVAASPVRVEDRELLASSKTRSEGRLQEIPLPSPVAQLNEASWMALPKRSEIPEEKTTTTTTTATTPTAAASSRRRRRPRADVSSSSSPPPSMDSKASESDTWLHRLAQAEHQVEEEEEGAHLRLLSITEEASFFRQAERWLETTVDVTTPTGDTLRPPIEEPSMRAVRSSSSSSSLLLHQNEGEDSSTVSKKKRRVEEHLALDSSSSHDTPDVLQEGREHARREEKEKGSRDTAMTSGSSSGGGDGGGGPSHGLSRRKETEREEEKEVRQEGADQSRFPSCPPASSSILLETSPLRYGERPPLVFSTRGQEGGMVGRVVCPASAILFYSYPLSENFRAARPLPRLPS